MWYFKIVGGRLAQLVEHSLDVRRVSGSSPLMSTKESRLLKQTGFLLIFLLRFNIFTLTLKFNEKQSADRLGRSSVFPLTKANNRRSKSPAQQTVKEPAFNRSFCFLEGLCGIPQSRRFRCVPKGRLYPPFLWTRRRLIWCLK